VGLDKGDGGLRYRMGPMGPIGLMCLIPISLISPRPFAVAAARFSSPEERADVLQKQLEIYAEGRRQLAETDQRGQSGECGFRSLALRAAWSGN
jgi:hypothetical protein